MSFQREAVPFAGDCCLLEDTQPVLRRETTATRLGRHLGVDCVLPGEDVAIHQMQIASPKIGHDSYHQTSAQPHHHTHHQLAPKSTSEIFGVDFADGKTASHDHGGLGA